MFSKNDFIPVCQSKTSKNLREGENYVGTEIINIVNDLVGTRELSERNLIKAEVSINNNDLGMSE